MSRIRHSKNELKAQREALARYERYLPMLQLKKQQLQAETRRIDAELEQKAAHEQHLRSRLERWIALFAEPAGIERLLRVRELRTAEGNIAGVAIPLFEEVVFARETPDLFASPPWVDHGLNALEELVALRLEQRVLAEQRRRIARELRTTTQRVNLFEKVKIPECRENIRIIRIFLGEEQTAAVARAKLAKGRAA